MKEEQRRRNRGEDQGKHGGKIKENMEGKPWIT